MKKLYLTLLLAVIAAVGASAQKKLYIPNEWKNNTSLYRESDPDNKATWSKSRSKESDNFIVYWENTYGNTIPTNAPSTYRVDIDDLLAKAEGFYAMNVGKLAFCDEAKSNVSKYKMLILMNHTTEWICYGGGYDDVIGALWLSPSTSKPVGHSVAHEVGHSFQYQVFADLKGYSGFRTAIGSGSTFWEQTAQWQANQSYPELKWSQSWDLYKKAYNYAMTHEWYRYQSYWWHYYLTEKYGIDFMGRLWRHDAGKGVDPNEALMSMTGMSVNDLYKEYFMYAMKMATIDLDVCRTGKYDEAYGYIGTLRYDYVPLGGTKHQVAYSSCPQATGFNVIPLNVPKAGTEVSVEFTSLRNNADLADGDSKQYFNGDRMAATTKTTYNTVSNYNKRGFRLGYVAYMKDGSRQYFYDDEVYCTGGSVARENKCTVGCTVPEGVENLFLVVSPAPSVYFQHKWDEKIDNDDQWPYTVEFTGTNILGAADIQEGKALSDVTINYDVYFAKSSNNYFGANVILEGEALTAIGTAFQMQTNGLVSVLKSWSSAGPNDGQAMFYAVNSNGELAESGSTANGYGHWFTEGGDCCSWGTSSYLYSEFNPELMFFAVGQYPGRLSNGKDYTIRQAIKYVRGEETGTATFVFNMHVTTQQSGYELSSIVYGDEEATSIQGASDAASQPAAYYSISGVRQSSLRRGVNIVSMPDGTTRKVYVK